MKQVLVNVRGTQRTVYLEKRLDDGRWLARTYTGHRSRTTVSGLYRETVNGVRRFIPTGVNANLV